MGSALIETPAIGFKLGVVRKYANKFEGLQGAAGVHVSLGVGGQQAEVSAGAANYNGISMATADTVYFLLTPRWDMDLSRDFWATIGWEMPTGTDTGVIWKLDMKGVAKGEAVSDAIVAPDASKVFGAVSGNGVNSAICEAGPAAMACAGLFQPAGVPDKVIQCAVTLNNSGDASADEIRLLYVDFAYTVGMTTDEARKTT